MLRKKKESIEWLEFELLAEIPHIQHAIFLRSYEPSREEISALLGCKDLLSVKQRHGSHIASVPPATADDCDGLITEQRDLGLMIQHADCQAAIFYDPVHRVIGNVHAGWRGNVQDIYGKMIDRFKQQFGTKAEDLLVCISPSLGPCCGEFRNFKEELPESFWPYQIRPTYFNLWEVAKGQLLQKGVLPHHIEIASLCTKCNETDFHSYRRDKTGGRHWTVITQK